MPDEEHAQSVPLFRAYLSRKPGGLLLVTVQSTQLPRPLFRMYPAELGEAAAVERSVWHAMYALKKCAPSKGQQGNNPCFKTAFPRCNKQHEGYPDNVCENNHALLPAVNVVAAEPLTGALPASQHRNDRVDAHCAEQTEYCDTDVEDVLRHGSPPIKPAESCTVCDYEPHSCACTSCPCGFKISPNSEGYEHHDAEQRVNFMQHGSPHGLHQPCQHAAVDDEQQACADGYAVKQHLRLRVVWQGLLS